MSGRGSWFRYSLNVSRCLAESFRVRWYMAAASSLKGTLQPKNNLLSITYAKQPTNNYKMLKLATVC